VYNFGPFAIRLHHFFSSDEDHVHDHPWWFVTLVLKGMYYDMVPCPACGSDEVPDPFCESCHGTGKIVGDVMRPGTVRFRPALHKHQVVTTGVWTLIISGRKSRDWGFWVGQKWMRQRKYFRKHESKSFACDD
jgi:hypothetical protein